jgi:hypothetical protein
MRDRIWIALVMLLALAAPVFHARAQSTITNGAPILQDLGGVDELRTLFERDRDKIRILLLLSPT